MADISSLARCMRGATHGLARPLAALGLLLATAGVAQAQTTTTFTYTAPGSSQTYTVPAGITKLNVVATGAAGGGNRGNNLGGLGAVVQATVTVVPGEVLTVVVGSQGGEGNGGGSPTGGLGGYNGGGTGVYTGGGGGGATDLRRATANGSTGDYLTSRNALLVASGGGGGDLGSATGGAAGTPNGGDGTSYQGGPAGQGATTTALGGGYLGSNGTGGNGNPGNYNAAGGGGYYGGGGGGGPAGGGFTIGVNGGGGGSSYVLPTGSSNVSYALAASQTNGALAITPVLPPTNNALAFDGTDDYAHVGTALPTTSVFTLEAWVNPTTFAGMFNVLLNGDNFPTGTVHCQFLSNGQLRFTVSGMNDMDSPFTVPTGRWSHVAVVYSATAQTLQFYLNGVLSGGTLAYPGGIAVASQAYSLGAWLSGGSPQRFFTGRYDEIRMYTTTLTAAQVQADMFSTSSAVPASQVAYYNFDQGTAGGTNVGLTSLTDQSGNGRAGTLSNFALTGTTSNWVRSFPTITAISPTTGNVGTSVTVTGTNLTDATGFAFNGTSTTGFIMPTSDLTATVTVPTGATTGPVSVSSATLTLYNGPTFTVITTWNGSISTDWYTAGNWSGGVPTSTSSAVVPVVSSGRFYPTIAAGTASALDLTVNAGASLTQTGGTLAPRGNLTNNGTFQPTGGTVSLSLGTAPSSILGSGNTRFWNLTVGASGAQSSTSASTSVQRLLTLNGNFTTNGNPLTLESNAANTAMMVNNGSNVVNGNVTVQRYIVPDLNASLGYRHVSSPISNATVASLATGSFSPMVNPAYNTSATPAQVQPFPTVYGYDQSRLATATNNLADFDKGWFSPASLSDALTVGQGYTVNLAANQTWNFVGAPNNGTLTQTLSRNSGTTAAASGLQLVGNPYPSPLDWSLVPAADRPNVDPIMYVFVSDDPTNPYTGSYKFFTSSSSGNIGTISPVLPLGQGFFVKVSAGQTSGTLTLRNSYRVTGYTNPTYHRTAETRPVVHLTLQSAGSTQNDDAFVYFEAGATNGLDAQYDGEKLANPSGLNLSSSLSATQRLCVNGLEPLGTSQKVVPLAVGVPAVGSYVLHAAEVLNLSTVPVYLRDLQTGALIDLASQPSYQFTVSNASALITGRFELVFSPQQPLATASAALAAQVAVYPNPASTTAFVELPTALSRTAVSADLVDAIGRTVRTQLLPAQGAVAHQVDLRGLATGVYALRLHTSAGMVVKKLVVE